MKIKIINSISNIKITTTKDSRNSYIVKIEDSKSSLKPLKEVRCGNIVTIGKYNYIILDNSAELTTVLFLDRLDKKIFHNNSASYEYSDIRKYLNSEYYNELCATIGKDNIIKHKVNLEAEDGTNKDKFCEDYVSLITTANYRRYREHIPATGYPWWTATRTSATDDNYHRGVCNIQPYGALTWGDCGKCYGVRPFCILKSSIMVQPVSPLRCLDHNEY